MRKFRHVYVELYTENVWFVKCNEATYKRLVREDFQCEPRPIIPHTLGRFEIYTGDDGIPVYTIWVTEWRILAHELMHCVHTLLDAKGLWLENASQEAYAYLIGYLDNKFRKGM